MRFHILKTVAIATTLAAAVAGFAEEPKCHNPAGECARAIRQMLAGRRYLGLDLVELKPGLVIKAVRPDSPASRAEFKEGDRIMAVNGKPMEQATAKVFKEALAEARSTGTLWVIVQRRGAYKKIEARLEPYPQEYIEKVVSGHLAQAHTTATAGGQR